MTDLGARADERAMLGGFLEWYRTVVLHKIENLPRELATRVMTPSGLTPLAIVGHLAAVEYGWFDETFLGNPVRHDLDDHGEFRLHDDDTVESVAAEYADACAHSAAIAAGAGSLDDLSVNEEEFFGNVSLRWIMIHMLEETARHAGHLDLMREQLDGRTGD